MEYAKLVLELLLGDNIPFLHSFSYISVFLVIFSVIKKENTTQTGKIKMKM